MARPLSLMLVFVSLVSAACAKQVPPPTATAPAPAAAPARSAPRAAAAARTEEAMMVAEPAAIHGSEFHPACDVPFGTIAQVRDIDNNCGVKGAGSDKSQLQNAVKNNFCAPGPPVTYNRQLGDRLNTAVDAIDPPLKWGSANSIPEDRSPLQNLITVAGQKVGEGSLVRSVLYFMDANFSNVSNGEKVNCDITGKENNDIHAYFALTEDEDDKCNSINAEITPHFRPDAWAEIVDLKIDPKRPMRVTGQLMLDASHKPCNGTHRSSPARFSSWEIHPVYNLEVCRFKSRTKCRVSNDSDWMALDDWIGEDKHKTTDPQ
jgi:hypothetical protein